MGAPTSDPGYPGRGRGGTSSAFAAVGVSDSADLVPTPECVYVGTGGNVYLMSFDDEIVPFLNVPDGTVLPFRPKRIMQTNTTASDFAVGY